MHQGRSESASSSYLQGTIRRGQTRIPRHTVSTSNSYFIHLQMLNAGHYRQRLRVRCYIELSAYFKFTLVSCCLFVCGRFSSSLRCTFSSSSSTEVALFRFVKFQTLPRTLLPTAADQSCVICYNVVRYRDSSLSCCILFTQ